MINPVKDKTSHPTLTHSLPCHQDPSGQGPPKQIKVSHSKLTLPHIPKRTTKASADSRLALPRPSSASKNLRSAYAQCLPNLTHAHVRLTCIAAGKGVEEEKRHFRDGIVQKGPKKLVLPAGKSGRSLGVPLCVVRAHVEVAVVVGGFMGIEGSAHCLT